MAPLMTAVVTTALLAACTTSPTTPSVAGVSSSTMTPVVDALVDAPATQPAPTAATAAPADDPVSRWALVEARLKAAHRASYTIVGHLRMSEGTVAFTRRFTVDADAKTLKVRAKYRDPDGSWDLEVVVAPAGAFARPGTAGAWHRATDKDLADAGVARDPDEASPLPEPLRSFVAQSDVGMGELSGYVDVAEGLRAVGLGALLVTDEELASNIGGDLYTTVTLGGASGLAKAQIDGADSTGWSDTTVYGGSKAMPQDTLIGIYSQLDVDIRIEGLDEPVDIHVPTRAEMTR